MEFTRHLLTAEMLEPSGDAVVRSVIEARVDPLTGHSSRILPGRGLMPASDLDLAAFARENQPRCPFCPERIEPFTPRLPAAIDPGGRITCGEAVLFPNLHAYSPHSCVSVYSPRLHADMRFESFNLAVYGAPAGTEGYPLNLRVACRSNLSSFYRSDSTFLERLHWEGAIDLPPETIAERLGGRFRA
jgi:galactose-1-phosphate uridylyltransferase